MGLIQDRIQAYGEHQFWADYHVNDVLTYKCGDQIIVGKVLWVAASSLSAEGKHMPPHYVVLRDGMKDGSPDIVLFGDVVVIPGMEESSTRTKCAYCLGYHCVGQECPLKSSTRKKST